MKQFKVYIRLKWATKWPVLKYFSFFSFLGFDYCRIRLFHILAVHSTLSYIPLNKAHFKTYQNIFPYCVISFTQILSNQLATYNWCWSCRSLDHRWEQNINLLPWNSKGGTTSCCHKTGPLMQRSGKLETCCSTPRLHRKGDWWL